MKLPIKLLEISNATIYQGEQLALTIDELTIELGQSLVILGPNGSGKSTFLKLIARDIFPVKTPDLTFRLFQQERWNIWQLRKQVGIISDQLQHHFLSDTTGLHIVMSGFFAGNLLWSFNEFTNAQKELAYYWLNEVGASHLAQRNYLTLSNGEQRKLLLARSLVHNPDLIIIDEPTNGLDIKSQFQMIELLERLINEGKTLILVTHDIQEIPDNIQNVMLIKQGRIQAILPKEKALTENILSELFDTPLTTNQQGKYYSVLPK